MSRSLFVLVLLAACGSSEPETVTQNDEVTAGGEAPEQPTGVAGVLVTRTPTEEERNAARAQREAERQRLIARCEAVPAPVPTRSSMPAIRATNALIELQGVYDQSQVIAAPTPADNTIAGAQAWAQAMSEWIRTRTTAIQTLEQSAGRLTDAERPTAAAWVGHSYLDVVEAFRTPAPPDEIAADTEARAVYRETLLEQTRPLAEQAKQAFGFCRVHAVDTLNTHCVEMEAYSASLACVLE